MPQPLRVGICTDQNMPWNESVERWRYLEALGFDSLWLCDHLIQPSNPANPYFEGSTLLAALATATERARIGVLVWSNTFRHPSLLAKESMTIDHISNGRLEVGIGAGWYVPEHEKFGLAFPAAGERVDRFREAVQIIDSLLRNETTTFHGQYYQLEDAPTIPLPIQRPRPPLTIGAKQTRMLRICAEFADRWNSSGSAAELGERNRILDEHCADIGRDPDEIIRSLYGWAAVMSADPWDSVDAFEQVVGEYREVGINELIIDQPKRNRFDVLERVATDVLPRLRAGG
ncbi:MAG TPA: LLM class flavin-dependent oxidoreductase [Thermomicrobiales bacterium]|nr:LLM class flavin-dependent oxidoreductase [Chloroflexota bacterium]HCG29482.1 LLM class flavin-dependent oxidoreductase [Chloroflexota bacterium]HQX62205.1 LLM class flavin-dependent oxidoreductase [Thermomicrobiales bacterium]HQZ89431.1 LLM class flavin-dependent oxidoreductase [Thermomicrobiales bacterium]HRA30573.1 LLM class flavin-dependent oxidoreductase [Thermomicrobiales bacterium]